MDYLRRFEPTPSALRNGRLTLGVLAVLVAIIVALIAVVPGFGDPTMVAITAATSVTLAGHVVSYDRACRPIRADHRSSPRSRSPPWYTR